MKLIQTKSGIITVGKHIIKHPLPYSLVYQELADVLKEDSREMERPNTYYRDMIGGLARKVGEVLEGKYRKSGFSKTSALTKGAHTHFWKDPDHIKEEGVMTSINTKRLLHCASGWYVNEEYDIERVVAAKDELKELLYTIT